MIYLIQITQCSVSLSEQVASEKKVDNADGPKPAGFDRLTVRHEADSWQQKRSREDAEAEAEAFWETTRTSAEGRAKEGGEQEALESASFGVVVEMLEEAQEENGRAARLSDDAPLAVAVAVALDDDAGAEGIPDLEDDDGLVGSAEDDDDGETVLFQSTATNEEEGDDEGDDGASGEGPPAGRDDATVQDDLPEGGVAGEDGEGEEESGIGQRVYV